MKNAVDLIKASLFGGFLVVLPLLLLYLMADEMIELLIGLSSPIVQLLPSSVMGLEDHPFSLALLTLALTSLLFGIFLKSAFMSQFFRYIERSTIGRLALYRSIKQLASGIFCDKNSVNENGEYNGGFRAAMLKNQDGSHQFAYLIEQDDDYSCVLIPHAPAGFAGPLKLVPNEKVTLLDASIGDVSAVLSQWGNGALALTPRRTP
ncbi:hypothetical protein [Shewanella kaireitica]|uniref:hypothetical protein n=1 Tax=Shewanella kaireitica TaxID=212021 RepID=UPI00200F9577|nr:hypothetical protein [Shewanella kaireitica]MCL1092192.1 hypothetical protein [Shewanella kaireitica]